MISFKFCKEVLLLWLFSRWKLKLVKAKYPTGRCAQYDYFSFQTFLLCDIWYTQRNRFSKCKFLNIILIYAVNLPPIQITRKLAVVWKMYFSMSFFASPSQNWILNSIYFNFEMHKWGISIYRWQVYIIFLKNYTFGEQMKNK